MVPVTLVLEERGRSNHSNVHTHREKNVLLIKTTCEQIGHHPRGFFLRLHKKSPQNVYTQQEKCSTNQDYLWTNWSQPLKQKVTPECARTTRRIFYQSRILRNKLVITQEAKSHARMCALTKRGMFYPDHLWTHWSQPKRLKDWTKKSHQNVRSPNKRNSNFQPIRKSFFG